MCTSFYTLFIRGETANACKKITHDKQFRHYANYGCLKPHSISFSLEMTLKKLKKWTTQSYFVTYLVRTQILQVRRADLISLEGCIWAPGRSLPSSSVSRANNHSHSLIWTATNCYKLLQTPCCWLGSRSELDVLTSLSGSLFFLWRSTARQRKSSGPAPSLQLLLLPAGGFPQAV